MYKTYIFCPKSKKPNVQNFQLFLPEGKTPGFVRGVFIELRKEISTGFIRKIFVGLEEIIGSVRYVLI